MSQVPSNQDSLSQVAALADALEQDPNRFDFAGMLKRRKWLIVFGLVVGIGLGIAYYVKAPIRYGASAEIFVQKQAQTIIPVAGPNTVMPEIAFESHEKVIASEFMAELTVEENYEQLRALPSFEGMSRDQIKFEIYQNLQVFPDDDDPNVYIVYFENPSETDCGKVVTAVIERYKAHLRERQVEQQMELRGMVNKAAEDIEKQIDDVVQARDSFRKENPEVVFGSEGVILNNPFEKLADSERALAKMRQEETDMRIHLEWIKEEVESGENRNVLMYVLEQRDSEVIKEEDPDPFVGQQQLTHMYRMYEMEVQMQELLENHGADHPNVTAHREQMDRYMNLWVEATGGPDAAVAPEETIDILGVYVSALVEQHAVHVKKMAEQQQAFEALRSELAMQAALQQTDEEFLRQYKRLEAVHDRLLDHVEEMNFSMQEEASAYDFEVLTEPASIAEQVAPDLVKVMAIACFGGLLLGAGLGYLVEVADKTFRSPAEITKQLQTRLLGHIPVITKDSRVDYADSSLDKTVVTFYRPRSKMAEAYRAVRTGLFFYDAMEDFRVIQVTSPSPGDGKTTLATNLAVSIANSGKSVIILDADLRRPRLHEVFGEDHQVGFSAVLAGTVDPQDATYETDVKNLWLMPCGARPANPSELLTTKRLPELLDVLKEQYDYVIVDTPPVLAVTDPCVVAPRVDAIVMTFRIKKNIKLQAERAREILAAVGGRVVGIVVNGVGSGTPVTNSRYGYGRYGNRYYNYNSGYGYGYGSDYELGFGEEYYEDDDAEDLVPADLHSNRRGGNSSNGSVSSNGRQPIDDSSGDRQKT